MARSLTNNFSLSYAVERTEMDPSLLGTVGDNAVKFRQMEPNTINAFSTSLTTVVRTPISKNRQNRKGAVTDLDSTAEFDSDLTSSQFTDFIEGAMFSKFTGIYSAQTSYQTTALATTVAGSIGRYSAVTGVTATDTYAVTGLTGVGEPTNRFVIPGSLMLARSFANAANNGIKHVSAVTDSTIVVDDQLATPAQPDLITETLTNDDSAMIETCGYRIPTGELTIAVIPAVVGVSGEMYTLTAGAGAGFSDWGSDLGLSIGSWIWLSGELAGGNEFDATKPAIRGWARVIEINGNEITVDKTLNTWTAGVNVSTNGTDIYFGRFIRNVGVDDTDAVERTYQFEARYDNLNEDVAGDPELEYSRGNFLNQMVINLPLTEKSTISYSFIGIDTAFCTNLPTKQGTYMDPNRTAAFNTTSDLARLRVNEIDQTGLTTDFKSITLTLSNNVSPEKVLGVLGARYVNNGNFDVTIETQALFTDKRISQAVRNYTTLTMDFSIANSDGAIYCDIPTLTLGGGGRDFPTGESILINLTGNAFADESLFNTTISFTMFPYVPSDATASTDEC